MAERPILFSASMVRAILSGAKTQTRRICKPQPVSVGGSGKRRVYRDEDFKSAWEDRKGDGYCAQDRDCPYGAPGDVLWVKETWRTLHSQDCLKPTLLDQDRSKITYEADKENRNPLWAFGKTRVSIHMPRWASRLALRIKSVRVERLQEISEADAIAEGIERVDQSHRGFSCTPWRNYRIGRPGEMSLHCSTPSRSYMTLWECINGAGSWDANPFVWVIEFERQ